MNKEIITSKYRLLVYDKKQYKWFPIEINDIICQIYYIQTLSSCIRNVQTLGEVSDERDV
jgi:hypothetical protein